MQTLFFVLAYLIGAYAQHEKGWVPPSKEYAPPAPTPVMPPRSKATLPAPIAESEPRKSCPEGFQHIGKQCVKSVHATPDVICPPGTSLVQGKCAKYDGKFEKCPEPFEQTERGCIRIHTAQPETTCPQGFTMTGKDQCSRRFQLPNRAVCPGGSVAKGDNCIKMITEEPQILCPTGFTMEGKRCIREETFDCTPPRRPTIVNSLRPSYKEKMAADGSGKKNSPTTVEEYILQSTCKRITDEPARRLCRQGLLDGKLCLVETTVEPIVRPGEFKEEARPALTRCPEGFEESGPGLCTSTETVAPIWLCPPRTLDLGDRCVIYTPSKTICPLGFALESPTVCVKTLFAAPVTEFSVTYTCTGKDCANH